MPCFDTGSDCAQHMNMDDGLREKEDLLIQPGGACSGAIMGAGQPAFSLRMPAGRPIPVLIAVPHAGRSYPASLMDSMRDPDYSCLRLEDRHVDQIASKVAQQTGAALLVAHAPRAMIDLNRAGDDVDWEMIKEGKRDGAPQPLANRRSRHGLGLIPRRLPHLGEIWKGQFTRDQLDTRIERVHRPYHQALSQALELLRDQWGAALLLDLHSMPPLKPKNPGDQPAELVIGDRFGASSDALLVASAFAYLAGCKRPAAHNRPYAGGYILDRHAAPARGIHAIQLELCRSTYLDSDLAEPSSQMAAIVRLITGLVRELGECTSDLGSDLGRNSGRDAGRDGDLQIAAE